MRAKTGRYSVYIRPTTYVLDLVVINLFSICMLGSEFASIYFSVFISLSWVIIALNIDFYEVYRFTKVVAILNKLARQLFLFTLVCFAFAGIYSKEVPAKEVLTYTLSSGCIVATVKLLIYYSLRRYRAIYGGNFRNVVLVGQPKNVQALADFFNDNPDYGYDLIRVFNLESDKKQQIDECLSFVQSNKIDEIYCALVDLSPTQVETFIDFADNNLKILKFLPDERNILGNNTKLDYYGYIPIISLRDIPLDDPINRTAKRIFDILFSIVIIIGFLSWLTPLLALIIKLESKGPVFFKQRRNGLDYKEFNCFKFRSMTLNEIADIEQVTKNDPRITRIGKFLRKSSIDELPQFFNVLLGDMSVVGPRPHMVSHTEMYARKIDKFMVRHFIKPGITGLAQTNGFRGEVENEKDIIYRVKYDIFYLENWSLLLDIKIIVMTVVNAVRGDEKAY
ncbi:undecaprenyl-phosphate glucose phosphotransferase [Flavobacterium aurantiibacter]|uniref:Undecaprenyl-phosphate glucose phosphotransferase n=1 Tax=Flavobacterium aurantiibacter TaxID=2023067 RepID=A0A255ZJA8_9FLAO|nr:undecaprenyl-phosphate glucose phosphotransferase [Flavobacterium aurantiibacter]OYQ41566.1 undecaprenyl-phosphate glucose phosphotransferase [Flavobacterium aurantiibacter]